MCIYSFPEECQFFVKLKEDEKEKFQVSEDEEEEDKNEDDLVTLLVQTERLVMVRSSRSWEWRMGCIRRYGWSSTEFYFESGRKSRSGEGFLTFLTDVVCFSKVYSRACVYMCVCGIYSNNINLIIQPLHQYIYTVIFINFINSYWHSVMQRLDYNSYFTFSTVLTTR